MSNTINVQIAKAKQKIAVVFEDLPEDVQLYIVEQGLSKVLNAATAKLTKATIEKDGLSEAQVADQAMGLVNKRVDELKAGKVKRTRSGASGKVPGVVMTEARRLAKNIIKASIKATGGRISDYEAKAITEAANVYLEENPELVEQAHVAIEAAKSLAAGAVVNTSAIPVSAERKAKNDAKKKAKVPSDLPKVAAAAIPAKGGGRIPAPTVHGASH